jgi:hypothetical protein
LPPTQHAPFEHTAPVDTQPAKPTIVLKHADVTLLTQQNCGCGCANALLNGAHCVAAGTLISSARPVNAFAVRSL